MSLLAASLTGTRATVTFATIAKIDKTAVFCIMDYPFLLLVYQYCTTMRRGSPALPVKASSRLLSTQVSVLVPTAKGPLGCGRSLKGRAVRAILEQPKLVSRVIKSEAKRMN